MEYGQSQLAFEFAPKPPRLLPPAVEPSASTKDRDPPRELFFLESIDLEEESTEPRIPPDEMPTTAEDPPTGVEFEWFDKHNYELSRFIKKYPPRVPHLLKRNIPPLRPPESIKPHEKIMGLEQIPAAQLSPANVTYVCLCDVGMPKKQVKDFHKALAPFINVEVLILRGLGLNNLKNCKYPNLRFLDLSNNQFDKIANIVALVKNSPNLEVANLLFNPCSPREDLLGRMLAVCPYLVTVNEKDLTVGERIHALEAHGPKSMKSELPLLRWDMALDLIPEITQMRFSNKGWDPQAIVAISLPNCGLTNIAVSTMVSLQTLDLSNNQITDLRNTGIEQCSALEWVNLKFNQISKMNTNFAVLAQVAPLRSVTLEGNPCALKRDYRSRLVFATRTLRGTNRSPGLQEIDGASVTIEERIAAVDAFGSSSESPNEGNAEVVRWNLNLIAKYGHSQIRGGFLGKAISCSLPNKNLGYANVAAFVALQYLDLSANHLTDIPGLENLEMLRMLDISENPRLKTNKVLKQLQKYTNLESFSFFVSAPDHKRVIKSKSYRDNILRTILAANRMLKFVDGIAITREERIETYGFGISPEEMEAYRFNLALTLNCCSSITSGGEAQRLHPSDVGIGAQYDPASITGLRRLTHYGITSRVCDFSAFVNLVELDISHNKLTDIVSIGLQGHRNLRVFCATHNAITTPLSKIGAMLDSIPHLEIVCLRENPIMRTTEDRMRLLGYLHSQRVFLPVLRVLDTEITLDERIDAWKKACAGEANDDEPERLRFAVVIQSVILTQPLVPQQTALTSLDLSHADLAFVNLSQFVHLRELNLLGNRIESLDSCVGISQLKLLEVLDLRFNLLSRLEAIAALACQMPLLETLGLLGNKCAPMGTVGPMASLRDLTTAQQPSYRVRFLSMVPDALHVRGHSLSVLDSKEVTIEERAQACKPDAASMALLKESLPNLQQQQQQERIDKRASTLSLSSIEQVAGQVANFLTMRKGSTGSSTNSLVDTKVMCWPMALLRKLPPTIPYVAITEADFSNCSLSLLDLSILPSLVKLSLANNSIREQQFDRSNIAMLADLRQLDIRSNQLKNLGLVCETVSRIPRLEQLWLDGNPCYPAENASLRVRFFKKMRRGDLLLRLLNGNPVMPPDLVKLGMSKQKSQSLDDG